MELFTGPSDVYAGADWVRTIAVQDRPSGLRALIVLNSLVRGPAFGGIRRMAYADEGAARADVCRLAAAMTRKCALAGLPAGGGKTVILDHPGFDREAGYRALGRAIDELGGRYVCGPDVGTGVDELAWVREQTRHVDPAEHDAGAATARGVLAGLRGLSRVVFGDESVAGRRYVIQGLGAVGGALAAELVARGGVVSGWDPDPEARARALQRGVVLLDEQRLWHEPCDVFMPCALGGVLTVSRCEQAPWRAVCGSANNQLGSADAEQVLFARRIAWAPDELVSAGAVIQGVHGYFEGPAGRARIERDIASIADTCAALLDQAEREGQLPGRLARAWADARLGEASRG